MSSEEVALVQQTESLVRSLAAARSARAMSELVAAGAAEYLSRRLAALLSPEGRLLPMGGGRAPVGLDRRGRRRRMGREEQGGDRARARGREGEGDAGGDVGGGGGGGGGGTALRRPRRLGQRAVRDG